MPFIQTGESFTMIFKTKVTEVIVEENMKEEYLQQMIDMCQVLYKKGLTIDYFPTNYVVNNGILYYVDYSCFTFSKNNSFENTGIIYWSKTPEFLEFITT